MIIVKYSAECAQRETQKVNVHLYDGYPKFHSGGGIVGQKSAVRRRVRPASRARPLGHGDLIHSSARAGGVSRLWVGGVNA